MPIDPNTLAVFVAAVFVLAITPGPDMLFITANGIAQGPRAGVVSALGVGTGIVVHTVFAAVGLTALILASPMVFDLIRYAGAAYLVWLGIQAIRQPAMLELHAARQRGRSLGSVFRGGILCNVLNPKVAVFVIAFLPQFVDPTRGSVALQIVLLGLVLMLVGTAFNLVVGLSGGGIGRYLATRPKLSRVQGWVSGIIFIGLAARLAISGQKS